VNTMEQFEAEIVNRAVEDILKLVHIMPFDTQHKIVRKLILLNGEALLCPAIMAWTKANGPAVVAAINKENEERARAKA